MSTKNPKRVPHDDETKAMAMALLATGTPVMATARQLGCNAATVRYWRAQMGQLPPKQMEHLAEVVDEYLDDAFQTISAILTAAQERDWILAQPASELAVFLGVITDKAVAVLDRIAVARGSADTEAHPPLIEGQSQPA